MPLPPLRAEPRQAARRGRRVAQQQQIRSAAGADVLALSTRPAWTRTSHPWAVPGTLSAPRCSSRCPFCCPTFLPLASLSGGVGTPATMRLLSKRQVAQPLQHGVDAGLQGRLAPRRRALPSASWSNICFCCFCFCRGVSGPHNRFNGVRAYSSYPLPRLLPGRLGQTRRRRRRPRWLCIA